MITEAQKLIDSFFTPPTGNSPDEITRRIQHWVDVANNPGSHTNSVDPYALAAKRRRARQNATRLIKRYPEVAKKIQLVLEVA